MGTIDEKLYHQSMVHLETELTEKLYNQNATTGFDHWGLTLKTSVIFSLLKKWRTTLRIKNNN